MPSTLALGRDPAKSGPTRVLGALRYIFAVRRCSLQSRVHSLRGIGSVRSGSSRTDCRTCASTSQIWVFESCTNYLPWRFIVQSLVPLGEPCYQKVLALPGLGPLRLLARPQLPKREVTRLWREGQTPELPLSRQILRPKSERPSLQVRPLVRTIGPDIIPSRKKSCVRPSKSAWCRIALCHLWRDCTGTWASSTSPG